MPTFKAYIAGRTAESAIVDADEFYVRDDSGDTDKRITYAGLKLALGSALTAQMVAAPAIDSTSPMYYKAPGNGVAASYSATPRTYLAPILLPAGTIETLAINVAATTAGASSWARAMIYEFDAATGLVGDLVAAGDNSDIATTGTKSTTLGSSVAVAAGVYMVAVATVFTSGAATLSSVRPFVPLPQNSAASAFTSDRGSLVSTSAPTTADDPFGVTSLFDSTDCPQVAVGMST